MDYRNIAIVAHVDHGKTTLVDGMLKQSHIFRDNQLVAERVMDSNDLERERGITILAKNTAVTWRGVKINIVDTPGHADFGGEVERALGMVDGVLLLVDAAEGPMPQTRFVLRKALARGLKPVVVVNKIDRKDARPDEVINLTFDLMVELGASDEQLDFPIVYAVAREGRAWLELDTPGDDLTPLFETILQHIPAAAADTEAPFQLQVTNLDYSDYLGRIAIGRVRRGRVRKGEGVLRLMRGGESVRARVTKLYTHLGLERVEVEEALAGDIVALTGVEEVQIGDTLTHPDAPEALPAVSVDEPTVSVTFSPNTSPLAGKEGKFVTSRHIKERLERELLTNVALRVEELGGESYRVSGRGELHLSILIEQMRREGYEFSVSRPEVIMKELDGVLLEPFEHVVADVPEAAMGSVMESLSSRRGTLVNLTQEAGRARLEFSIPSRALFGYRTHFLSMTQGEGLLNHTFDGYEKSVGGLKTRLNGSLVAMEAGEAFAYAIFKLQDRGVFFIDPGTEVYVGMIVGANARAGDLNVNVTKNKKLTNVRAATADDNITLTPPKKLTLEEALEYIADDELLEVTPKSIRLRKRILDPSLRKREEKVTAGI
ncbi:translational GTPase TypA [Truepera radiovictrix]|uniref:Large ribosomal subunit assembly factor BipA n=1 Tax=Truepera radiovictrix (strain DSM 17093 / CIP 108686 / LMG 22925 / RQ-24) TaxID=649638 RepID=D7CRA1_TRURR|nr:translational GTPase TypA [Truepera radiovictrix]ADI15189.1 GTP-binding protein TypA [Truepera radiovictrix DSM 17093]WMT56260.1 translational GTPase TypA [Truepera radiovictrix]